MFNYRGYSATTTKRWLLRLVPRLPRAPQIISVRLWGASYRLDNLPLSLSPLLVRRHLTEIKCVPCIDWASVWQIHARNERSLILQTVRGRPVQILFTSKETNFFRRWLFPAYQLRLNLTCNANTTRFTTRLTTSMPALLLKVRFTQTALTLLNTNIFDTTPVCTQILLY